MGASTASAFVFVRIVWGGSGGPEYSLCHPGWCYKIEIFQRTGKSYRTGPARGLQAPGARRAHAMFDRKGAGDCQSGCASMGWRRVFFAWSGSGPGFICVKAGHVRHGGRFYGMGG